MHSAFYKCPLESKSRQPCFLTYRNMVSVRVWSITRASTYQSPLVYTYTASMPMPNRVWVLRFSYCPSTPRTRSVAYNEQLGVFLKEVPSDSPTLRYLKRAKKKIDDFPKVVITKQCIVRIW